MAKEKLQMKLETWLKQQVNWLQQAKNLLTFGLHDNKTTTTFFVCVLKNTFPLYKHQT